MPNFVESLAGIEEHCHAILVIFQSFVYSICNAMTLSNCGVCLTKAKLVLRDPRMWVHVCTDPFKYEFLQNFGDYGQETNCRYDDTSVRFLPGLGNSMIFTCFKYAGQ